MTIDPRPQLIEAANLFYQRGWMVGTAGNLSAKASDDSFWITASGKSKGKLQPTDFVRVNLSGELVESSLAQYRPSAETSIHQAIYSLFPQAQACFHVHSVEANLVSRWAKTGDRLPLPPIEMIKGLGIWDENPEVAMPVFKNYPQVPLIAQEICDRFSQELPAIPALLIADHGVTVWAESVAMATNYVEVAEYLFRYQIEAHKVGL
jgi:methylthioribulose-1-phosphate dehydratase